MCVGFGWRSTGTDIWQEDLSDDEVTERGVAVPNETLWERISALKDIVSPATRASLSKTFRTYSAYGFFGGWVCAKLIWVGVTSAIMVGLPFALAVEDESRITAQEKEMYGAQGAPQGLPAGSPAGGEPHAAVQPGETQGLRPPGF